MSGKSIWIDATSVALSVYTSANTDFSDVDAPLWTGQLALGGSTTFADQAGWSGATLTLAVDATGVVSLVSDIDLAGLSGRKFLVMASPAGIDLPLCQWAQMVKPTGIGVWNALYADSIGVPWAVNGAWTDPQDVPPTIQSTFGYGAGWNGG